MKSNYFPQVEKQVPYESRDSDNPLTYKYYQKDQNIGNKTMAEHLRFSIAYSHTLIGDGTDLVGSPTSHRNWRKTNDSLEHAKSTMEATFEFFQKLNIDYYYFHDRDIAPEGENFVQLCKNL